MSENIIMPKTAFCLRPLSSCLNPSNQATTERNATYKVSKFEENKEISDTKNIEPEELFDTDSDMSSVPLAKKLISKLKESKQLLTYKEFLPKPRNFIFSNEFNLYSRDIDTRKAEIFVGAGSNSVWDLAVRRSAEIMIIWDMDPEVIIAQEYLFKPLILIAKTPAEFASLLSAVPLPANLINSNLEYACLYIKKAWKDIRKWKPKALKSSDIYINEIEERIKAHPMLGAQHALFVKRHLEYRRNIYRRSYNVERKGLHNVFSHSFTPRRSDDPYKNFVNTYSIDTLIKRIALPPKAKTANFSCFSSQESFDKLKNLFEKERVYYIVGNIFIKNGYIAIKELSKKTRLKVSGLSITNIVDCLTDRKALKQLLISEIIMLIKKYLKTDKTFTLYQSHTHNVPYFFSQISKNDMNTLKLGNKHKISDEFYEAGNGEDKKTQATMLSSISISLKSLLSSLKQKLVNTKKDKVEDSANPVCNIVNPKKCLLNINAAA